MEIVALCGAARPRAGLHAGPLAVPFRWRERRSASRRRSRENENVISTPGLAAVETLIPLRDGGSCSTRDATMCGGPT
jgi:hypothetical protein